MSRPSTGWAHIASALARLVGSPAPWMAADTRHAAEVLLRRLARDARAVVARDGAEGAAEALGIDRATVYRARAEGGWLAGP